MEEMAFSYLLVEPWVFQTIFNKKAYVLIIKGFLARGIMSPKLKELITHKNQKYESLYKTNKRK